MIMKALLILVAICLSANAFAQCAAEGRQQAARSSKAERTNGLQTCPNGQGHQAMGR
jgi:hypothetical protein